MSMQVPLTVFPKATPRSRICCILYDGKRYLIYPKYRSCMVYLIRDDMTFAFIQLIKPLQENEGYGHKCQAITQVAVHEGLGIIGMSIGNRVFCYAPTLLKYEVKNENGDDNIFRNQWRCCATLKLEEKISCISWMPGIKSVNVSSKFNRTKMIVIATACKELTIWECTLSHEIQVDKLNLKSFTDKMFIFNKRYSTPVSSTITYMSYSYDGFFLAVIGLNSRFAKVIYEYDKFAKIDNLHISNDEKADSICNNSLTKKKTTYCFAYLPHPKCVYDASWKPYDQNHTSNADKNSTSDCPILLTNCHDGAARVWVPVHDCGIIKFCLVSFIQSNPIDISLNLCYELKVEEENIDLNTIFKKQKKNEVIFNPVVWMPLCTNARDYRESTKPIGSPKNNFGYANTSGKCYNNNENDMLGTVQKPSPFYDFIDLGKKQLDTGQPTLFQVKKDSTILFCKFEGYNEKTKSYPRSSSHICGFSCLENSQSASSDIARFPNMHSYNIYAGEKSLKPKVIMCALSNPCDAFINFFSGSSVMPYLFVNPEPQVIEYNNIVLLEKVLLIGVKCNGQIQAFTLFIKVREDNLWVIPRMVPLQSFYTYCDIITNIWPHSNVNIPLHIVGSRMCNGGCISKKLAFTNILSIHFGPLSSYSSLIAVLKIKPCLERSSSNSPHPANDEINVEWVQSSPTFIVWGRYIPKPLLYTVKIPNNTIKYNLSPMAHLPYSGNFETGLFPFKSFCKNFKTKKREHKGHNSDVFYTMEDGLSFLGYLPLDYSYNSETKVNSDIQDHIYSSNSYKNDTSKHGHEQVITQETNNCDTNISNSTKSLCPEENDSKGSLPYLIMVKAFDSASHIEGVQPSDTDISVHFKSSIIAVFNNGLYCLCDITFDKTSGLENTPVSIFHLPDVPPGEVIKRAEHLFSPCDFFQLSFTLGYHLFALVKDSSNKKNSLMFYRYGTSHKSNSEDFLEDNKTLCNGEKSPVTFLGENSISQEIKIIKGDMLEFACTIGKMVDGRYRMSIWKISEKGTYRRLVYSEFFDDEIVSADWLVMSSSQVILAIAQSHRIMVYCRLNRSLDGGKKLWTRIDPYTAKSSEKIYAVKWLPSDSYKLAVITEELVFLLDDQVDNWNLPVSNTPLPEIKSRINLSLFSEVDAFEEQPCNCDVYKLYRHTLLGNFDFVNYVLKTFYQVMKNAPNYASLFQRVCLIWTFEDKSCSNNDFGQFENIASACSLGKLGIHSSSDIAGQGSKYCLKSDENIDIGKDIRNSEATESFSTLNNSQFEQSDYEYIKKYVEENNLNHIGEVEAELFLKFMEIYLMTRGMVNKFGINSLRYIISMLMHRGSKREIYSVDSSIYIWAFLCKSRTQLIAWVKEFYGGKMSWKDAREAGIGWWVSDKDDCIEITELIARTEFVGSDPGQIRHDPLRCMLFYAIIRKNGVLKKMWEIAKEHPESHIMQTFLNLDLTIPKNRNIIQKNAFGLLSRGRFIDAVTLFVLIGKIHEASSICAKKLNDISLALLICKTYDGNNGPIMRSVIQQILLPIAVENGNRFECCMLFCMLECHEKSMLSMVAPLQILLKEYNDDNDKVCKLDNNYWNSIDIPANKFEKELLMDPLIYSLFMGLTLNYQTPSESFNKYLLDYLPGFILQSTSRYESLGMYYIAFTLARHITWDSDGLLPFIHDNPWKGANGKLENALVIAAYGIANDTCEPLVPKCEMNLATGQFWDFWAVEVHKESEQTLPSVSSFAKLSLWRLTLRFIKDFCISIDTVTTKLLDPFFSSLFKDYAFTCISNLKKIIRFIKMPYSVISRTVIMLCRNLNITGVFPILQVFIEGSQFLKEDDKSPVPIESQESALFDEFTSLVFTVCYRQITILLNVYSLRLYESYMRNMKATERGQISMHMQRQWVKKAGAIARQTLLSIVMCKNTCINLENEIKLENDEYEITNIFKKNKMGNALYNYATVVELFFTVFVSLLEESMLENYDVLLDLVIATPNLFSIVYRIYSLKSLNYDESTSALFTEVDNILTDILMNENDNSKNSISEHESFSNYMYDDSNKSPSIYAHTDDVECLTLGFLKIAVLSYVISELDKFLGNLMTEIENPLDDDIYWFILELIARPLNRALCDMQLDYAYYCATQMVLKLETMKKTLISFKLKDLFDYMFKVQDVPYIYEITKGLSRCFNIMHPKNSYEFNESPFLNSYSSSEIKPNLPLKILPYISCSHRLVHFTDSNISCFAVNQANSDIVAVASNDLVNEISISEISCIMKSASSLSSVSPLKRLVKKFEISKNNILKDSGSQVGLDLHKRFPKVSMDSKSLSSSSMSRVSSSLRNTYKSADHHLKIGQNKIPHVTSLDSHPTLAYYIQCVNGNLRLSANLSIKSGQADSVGDRKGRIYGAATNVNMPYIQLAHFGKTKALMKFSANCSYLTRCKFDHSGARFGAVGTSEKVFVWNFDSYSKATSHLVDYSTKIALPNDLIFMESSSIVCIAGEGGQNENNISVCDFLLPTSRCVVKEFKTPSSGINCVVHSREKKLLFAGGHKGCIYVYDLRTDSLLTVLNTGSEQRILSLYIENSVSCILCGGNNNTIEVWDINNMKHVDTWKMASSALLQSSGQQKSHRLNLAKEDHQKCSIIGIKASKQSGDIIACSNHGGMWKCRFFNTSSCSHV